MDKEMMFHDFKLICKMNASPQSKVGMLTYLFAQDPKRWRVTGITESALKRLKENSYRKTSGIKINRAHKHARYKTYQTMLNTVFIDAKDWWNYYYNHDETILSTSSENISGNFSKVININPLKGLFKSVGYSWSHRKAEIEILQQLYNGSWE